jgi:hypothetical protein
MSARHMEAYKGGPKRGRETGREVESGTKRDI